MRDNIIEYSRASLYSALMRLRARGALGAPAGPASRAPDAPALPRARWHAVQMRTAHAECLPHDMPLYLDDEWPEVLRLLAAAFDPPTAGGAGKQPGDGAGATTSEGEAQPPAPSVGERARALAGGLVSGLRPKAEVGDGSDDVYTRMML
jgi:hypothetical protein